MSVLGRPSVRECDITNPLPNKLRNAEGTPWVEVSLVVNDQLQKYFDTILSILLSAFRKMYTCQAILLKMVTDWKMTFRNYQHRGIILIDLPNAFDSIPHS